jgi:DNA replication protein DnaC
MNRNETLEQLKALKLEGMAGMYGSILELPVTKHPEAHTMIAQMVDREYYNRKNKRQEMYLRLSKLRYKSTVEEVICSKERNLSKETISDLSECSYIQRGNNVLISGSTGCGKSYLACALAHEACSKGYKVLYYNMNKLIEQIMLSKVDGSYLRLLAKLEKIALLVIDDFGMQAVNNEIGLSLLQILEDRYKKKATIIVSQLPVTKWPDTINDATIGDAIIDRILHNSEKIELKGRSMREGLAEGQRQGEPSSSRPTGSLQRTPPAAKS